MTVLGRHIPEQIFSRDELIPDWDILSFINLKLNIYWGHLMDCRGPKSGSIVLECPGPSCPKICGIDLSTVITWVGLGLSAPELPAL
jgi:hypothetical protein